jgi:hypothetical protein
MTKGTPPNGWRSRSMVQWRAWNLFGNRKNSKPEKCLGTAQNPQRPMYDLLGGSSLLYSITEVNLTVAKATFLQKLKLQSNVVWERCFATSHDDRFDE